MPLLHLQGRAALLGAGCLPLNNELYALVISRVRHAEAGDLLDLTEIVAVDGGSGAAEIFAATGFDPLVDLNGRRYPDSDFDPMPDLHGRAEEGFASTIDWVARVSPRYHEAIVCVGDTGFAYLIFVEDGAEPTLVRLMRELAA